MCASRSYGAKVSQLLEPVIIQHLSASIPSQVVTQPLVMDGTFRMGPVTRLTTNPAPGSVLQLVHCSCKTSKRETQRCS